MNDWIDWIFLSGFTFMWIKREKVAFCQDQVRKSLRSFKLSEISYLFANSAQTLSLA